MTHKSFNQRGGFELAEAMFANCGSWASAWEELSRAADAVLTLWLEASGTRAEPLGEALAYLLLASEYAQNQVAAPRDS